MQMYMDQFALVEYYKTRLDSLERDFSQALDKIDSLKVPHAEHHALAWQVHRREAEVAEMQQALSDAQTQVFDERKMLLKAIAENDDLKIQELKDRKKIRYLLSMTGNMEPEVTYFRDRLNKRLVKIASQDRIDKPLENRLLSTDRDIIILEDEIEGLKLKISSLYTQLDEQKQSYEETIAGLERDRKTLLEEENIRRKHEAKKMEEMLDKSDNLRQLNRENVRELLHLKKTLHQNERRLVEDKTRLTNEILELKSQYKNEKERVEHVEQQVEAKLVQKHVDLTTGLRHQLQKSTEELVAVKKRNEELERNSKKNSNVLGQRVEILTKNYNSLRRRRDYEIEGFTNDILMLRKQLKNLEKSILKYGPLEDRELVLLNMARETGNRAAQISSDLQGLKVCL
ncbi:Coiled-coil domain-containing protein 77 [Chytriomyces hyalinus]|nr:Coiled-coil domain-containing protein 77 [Chytriomyces hyalinus]